MTQKGHREEANHHQLFASPLRNRLPVLTVAAGYPNLDKFNGHQCARGVAVPKLVDPIEGGNEPSAVSWRRTTSGSRYHDDYTS